MGDGNNGDIVNETISVSSLLTLSSSFWALLSNSSPRAQLRSYLIFPKTSYDNGDDDDEEEDDFGNDDGIDDDSGSGYCLLNTYYIHHLFTSLATGAQNLTCQERSHSY